MFKKNESTEYQDDDNNYERRSILDSTTIASQNEDEESDFDELNNQEEKQVSTKYKQSGFYIPRYPRQEYQIDLFYFVEPDSKGKNSKKMMLFQSKLLSWMKVISMD